MSETKLLEMTNITKAFASNVVLNGVNLSVDEGEVVAILGENGAGKSTLIKILGGIYKADSGEIRMHGTVKNITSAAIAGENGIRIIHQEIVLVPDRTIAANVFLGREPKNKFGFVDVQAMEQQTQKLIDDLHLNLYVVLFMFIYRYINVRFQQSNKQKSQKNQQIISAD